MRRPMLLLFAGLLLGADAPADANKKELDKFQGLWELVPPDNDANAVVFKVEFKEDKVRAIFPDGGELKGTFKIDASTDPKIIDVSVKNRGDFEGIYKFDGEKLVICMSEPCTKQRPAEFAKDGKNIAVLKRIKE
jgi:uncharacterized protein (TIGR03067 family)